MATIGFDPSADFICTSDNAQQQIELAMKTNDVLEFGPGRYVFRGDRPIMLASGRKWQFRGSGMGQTIFCPAGNSPLHTLFTSYGNRLSSLLMKGISFNLGTCPDVGALQLYQGNMVEIDSCEFYGQTSRDPNMTQWTVHLGAYKDGQDDTLASFGLKVHDCYFHDNRLNHSNLARNAEALIIINQTYAKIYNNRFESNYSHAPQLTLYIANIDVDIRGNSFTNSQAVAINITQSADINIESNTIAIANKDYEAITIVNSRRVNVESNKITGAPNSNAQAIEFWDRLVGPDDHTGANFFPVSNNLRFVNNEFDSWKFGFSQQRTDVPMKAYNILIASNKFKNIGENPIYLGANHSTNSLSYISILGNDIISWSGSHTGAIMFRGYIASPIKRVYIINNRVAPSSSGEHSSGIRLINTAATSVSNNDIRGTGVYYEPISLIDSSVGVMEGNLV